MKKILILLSAIIIITSCTDVQIEYYPDGVVRSEIEGKEGIRNGVAKWYHPNGMLEMKVNFINDKEEGEVTSYYSNGKLNVKASYLHGLQDGVYLEFFDNGVLKSEQNFKLGKLDGLNKFYHQNGALSLIAYVEEDTTKYFDKYDSLGNWLDEYRSINITVNDTILLGENITIDIELKGPEITEKDSVLFIFSIYKYENLEIIKDTTINITPSNLLHFSYIAKENGYFGYTGLFVTNRTNQRRKEHQIPKGSFYVVNNEKTAMN